MKTLLAGLFAFTGVVNFAHAQQDSTRRLNEVTIRPYFTTQTLIRSTGAIGLIDSATLAKQSGNSFVSAANTIPGVRMEERSPGSYRLSIRGSLLRSPFGIRNVKVYLDEFPLTDAGGNTYLNLIDPAAIERIAIIKGPDGSLFGANSGGVVRIGLLNKNEESSGARIGLNGGSFGTLYEHAAVKFKTGKNILSVSEALQRSDGYRDNSRLKRMYFHILDNWHYSPAAEINFLF